MKKKQKVRPRIKGTDMIRYIFCFVLILLLENAICISRRPNTVYINKNKVELVESETSHSASNTQLVWHDVEPEIDSLELELYAHIIFGEAGNMNDECQQAVGMVVKNRVASDLFPDTTKEVIFQKGQYACTWDGNFDKTPTKQAYDNARKVILGQTDINVPPDVIFQAQFVQGSGVWRTIGNQYFCYR